MTAGFSGAFPAIPDRNRLNFSWLLKLRWAQIAGQVATVIGVEWFLTAFIVHFLRRVTAALAQRELAEANERALRQERLASLATMSAGAAHELSTPLGTIAVVAKELERALVRQGDQLLIEDAQLIREQVSRCRGIKQSVCAYVVATALSLLAGCSGGMISSVPPSLFEFTNVVPYDGDGTGGWKVAQVVIILARLSAILPENSFCHIEVGVPEVNRKGPVSTAYAQRSSARSADAAGREVLRERLPTAMLCRRFRTAMERILRGDIPGASVGTFTRDDIPRREFP
ncbi:hypothetical protein [Haliangium sp.]|uniref:hypothetical protein n=1 Tax=Haliangium sp. TaxID=2663208 RepID=UPI003D0AFE8B